MVDTTKLHALAVYLRRAGQPSNAAQVQDAADHIDRLTTELSMARAELAGLRVIKSWSAPAADICSIPESAFPDYPARDDCQSGAAQRMAPDAIDTAWWLK